MAKPDAPITVSVVIPAYNAELLVGDGLASALAQTYPIREIVVVDDGSKDSTLAVLRRFESENPGRIRVLTGPNRGGSAARNRGLAQITADYVQFLDADDLLLPDKIERDVALLQPDRPPLLFGLHKGATTSRSAYVAPPFSHGDAWLSFSNNRFGHTTANLFRRDAVLRVGGWDESRPFNQEYDLIARMLTEEPRVAFGDHYGTRVRRQPGSVSAVFSSEMREARLGIDARVLNFLKGQPNRAKAVSALEASIFLQVRQLYTRSPERSVEWHHRLFGTGGAPPVSRSNTAAYRAVYRWLGFAGAERAKMALDSIRARIKSYTLSQ